MFALHNPFTLHGVSPGTGEPSIISHNQYMTYLQGSYQGHYAWRLPCPQRGSCLAPIPPHAQLKSQLHRPRGEEVAHPLIFHLLLFCGGRDLRPCSKMAPLSSVEVHIDASALFL